MPDVDEFFLLGVLDNSLYHSGLVEVDEMVETVVPEGLLGMVFRLGDPVTPVVAHPDVIPLGCQHVGQTLGPEWIYAYWSAWSSQEEELSRSPCISKTG